MTKLVYFSWVRERIGLESEDIPLPAAEPLDALVERLRALSAGHRAALADRSRIRAAINQDFVGWDAIVHPDDEVALFPPVTGG